MFKFLSIFVSLALLVVCQGCVTLAPNKALASDGTLSPDAKAQIDKLIREDDNGTVVVGLTDKGGATPAEIQALKEATIQYFVSHPGAKGKELAIEFRPDLGVAMASAGDYARRVTTPVWEMTTEEARAAKGELRVRGQRGRYRDGEYTYAGEQVGIGDRRDGASAGVLGYSGHTETVRTYNSNQGPIRVITREYYFGGGAGVKADANVRVRTERPRNWPGDRTIKRDFDERYDR